MFDENENEHLMLIVGAYGKNRRRWERYTIKDIPIFWNGVKMYSLYKVNGGGKL